MHLPIMRRAYVAWVVLATVYNALPWYTMEYFTCYLNVLGIHSRVKARVYTEKMTSDKWEILWYTTGEHCITNIFNEMCIASLLQHFCG